MLQELDNYTSCLVNEFTCTHTIQFVHDIRVQWMAKMRYLFVVIRCSSG